MTERRFDAREARAYWEMHGERRAHIDLVADPEGLGNVCHHGEPDFLNRYYAKGQARVFRELLERVGAPVAGARALDVGCGAGRWCRILAEKGYAVTGIDLQEPLIEHSRRVLPEMVFVLGSIQEFEAQEPFDLVTSVTVIQHIPFDEHLGVLTKIHDLLRPGGHAVLLENVVDQGPYVFSRSRDGWRGLFEAAGLTTVQERPYDYSPSLRLLALVRRAAGRRRSRGAGVEPSPESYLVPTGAASWRGRLAVSTLRAAQRAAVSVDSLLDPRLRTQRASTVHCGFLLRAR